MPILCQEMQFSGFLFCIVIISFYYFLRELIYVTVTDSCSFFSLYQGRLVSRDKIEPLIFDGVIITLSRQ